MSKLDKNQRVQTSMGRNVFDLSHDYLFTATTGQLRPVSHDLVQPGDKISGKFDFFARTMPLSTAAMMELDFFVDYFFVPLELLWLPFGAWWSQTRSYPFSRKNAAGVVTNDLIDRFPRISYETLSDLVLASDNVYQNKRLCDDLGFSGILLGADSAVVDRNGDDPLSPSFFPWQFLAYQCIYQHFYRDDEREPFNQLSYSINADSSVADPSLASWFEMRYLNRQDDYFTSTKLSPLVSNINNNPSFLGNFDLKLGSNSFYTPGNDVYPDLSTYPNSAPINLTNIGEDMDGGEFNTRSVNQLRALFAQEKLLHVMNMTNKNYDSQVLSRLGYDVPKDVKHGVQHLGHDVCSLNIQEIVSGSNTFDGSTGSELGDIAGQGKAFSKDFKGFRNFVVPCHGVIMSIFSSRPRQKYTTSVLRKDLIQDITDFFTPELDDLGMQPQYLYESQLVNRAQSVYADIKFSQPFTITGWNYRYEYLKRNFNRASLAFMRAQDLAPYWKTSSQEGEPPVVNQGFNTYQQWSSVRIPLNKAFKTAGGLTTPTWEDDFYSRPHYDLYKVRPDELNNIMKINWLPSPPWNEDMSEHTEDWVHWPWLIYQRDPLLIDGHFNCKKVSAMSIYSMPKLV